MSFAEAMQMSTLHFSPRANRAAEINWQPWDRATFARADRENKPVLLAISAVWCHWCHVMDETSYSDPAIISKINERFVPVRVDNDQRPDVNARYNMGGWPTTALLTPDGEVLYGGTYIPPDGMLQILGQVDALYSDADNRLSIAEQVAKARTARQARARTPRGGDLDPHTAANVVADLWSAFDQEYGGFGSDQKFPHVSALHFLLDWWSRTRDERAQSMVQRTLHAMADGGMYDHVQGGFFRYSTTRDFSVPHFEKMLEDNAGLLQACARAGAMFDGATLRRTAADVKRYLDEHLWNDAWSAYGGSQDADEAYYALDASGRAPLPEPYVDRTAYGSWNAQAAVALLTSGPLLDHDGVDVAAWTSRGCAILETLWARMFEDGLLYRHYDGEAHVRGLLGDQVWGAWSALIAFGATGAGVWLRRCRDLIDAMRALYDPEAEAYLDRLPRDDDAGRVAVAIAPLEENALMARVLSGYAAVSGDESFAQQAQAILRRHARDYRSQGLFAAAYAAAVLDALEPPVDVHIVGAPGDTTASALRIAALRTTSPPVRLDPIDPHESDTRAEQFGEISSTQAFLCRGTTCFARAGSAAELTEALALVKT
jgi:uncharacterized protein YyaL (SSP411 family)